MAAQEINIASLLSISEPADFAAAVYQTFLERSLGPSELLYAVSKLQGGLSHRGFIGWVARSEEFGHRFSFSESGRCYTEYDFFRTKQKLNQCLHWSSVTVQRPEITSPVPGSSPHGWIASGTEPESLCLDSEYDALANAAMTDIPSAFPDDFRACSYQAYGHIAADLLPAEAAFRGQLSAEELFAGSNISAEALFITNPAAVYRLLTSKNALSTLTRHLQKGLVFTMPTLPASHDLTVIWDKHWYPAEADTEGHPIRWGHGDCTSFELFILNQSAQMRRIQCSFILASPMIGSKVVLECALSRTEFLFEQPHIRVSLDFWLNPGCNTLRFIFAGKRMPISNSQIPSAAFAISEFTLSDFDNSCEYDASIIGSGYFPYILPDAWLRSTLHRGGFFEIEALKISAHQGISRLPQTRFLYAADSRHDDCWYTYKEADSTDQTIPGVAFYAARRTGTFEEVAR